MKRSFKYIPVIASAALMLSLNSCKEDFLDVDYYDIVPADFIGQSESNAIDGLTGCYKMMLPSDQAGDWGFKPNLFVGCHPTMDTQATGWDKDWLSQNWNADSKELAGAWKHVYNAISRCNDFLAELEKADEANVPAATKKQLTAEAKALRGFFYHWLAQEFGKVPMLSTGETYVTNPEKASAATDAEMWNFIIKDLKEAADVLDWTPWKSQYGRCTKGMALSYLADALMWKGERCGEASCFAEAAGYLKQIIDSKTYELSPSFSMLFDPCTAWSKEAIWEEVLNERDKWNDWGIYGSSMHLKFYCACPQNDGWGSLFLSWEWWKNYEQGDKRRDASGATGPVFDFAENQFDGYEQYKSEYSHGKNPFLNELILGGTEEERKQASYPTWTSNDGYAQSIWCLKYWRVATNGWSKGQCTASANIYYMRYANVLMNYAECLFRANENDPDAWAVLDQIRDRAFGNQEMNANIDNAVAFYNSQNAFFNESETFKKTTFTDYPIPMNKVVVTVKPAKDLYTEVKAAKGYTIPVWKVALLEETRKEFNAEWCLTPILTRLGVMAEHIEVNYPKHQSTGKTDFQTGRSFDFNDKKMLMPIPNDELIKNPLCTQNEAYL